jgi:HD-GYP domain-containing protein (c-di-GMP phosphodiesterase class II)
LALSEEDGYRIEGVGEEVVLILPVEEARPGMKLAAPVQHPENPEQRLLKKGYVLEEEVVHRLADMGISQVFIDYPALDDLDRHLEPFMSPNRRAIYSQIKTVFAEGQSRTMAQIPYKDYYMSVRELVVTLISQGRNPIYLEQMARLGGDSVGHAAAVAHMGLLLGIQLEQYLITQRKRLPPAHAKEVVNIGVAAMLHDVGKLKLPPHLAGLNCLSEFANDSDRLEFESHPRLGYEMVHAGIEPSAATAVLNHHQHHDGSGYPTLYFTDGSALETSGNKIHVFARILQVADLFDRLANTGGKIVAGQQFRQRRSNLEVLFDLRNKYVSWCDPEILQTLHAITPPFPPGSKVGLDDGTDAVVTEVDVLDPYRPTVQRMLGAEWTLEPTPMNLMHSGMPKIRTIGGVEVEPFMPG